MAGFLLQALYALIGSGLTAECHHNLVVDLKLESQTKIGNKHHNYVEKTIFD